MLSTLRFYDLLECAHNRPEARLGKFSKRAFDCGKVER